MVNKPAGYPVIVVIGGTVVRSLPLWQPAMIQLLTFRTLTARRRNPASPRGLLLTSFGVRP